MISTSVFINSFVELLTEAYDGPLDPSSTWFIDNEPNSGILGILEKYFSGLLALLPHAAYHLDTIRQMVERVRS